MRTDDDNSFTHVIGKDRFWKYGAEIWCNMEGQYVHFVGDLSHHASDAYE